ncbi:DUF3800 domain-containing protein [Rhodospira trueperi]|uniref:DUF3800 domain-containing protein n=1 Tax=Rhodospira trueperi TaxID=69960 RepID=A0A1G7GYQ5_9PROT|nr:DUF3800 domain-containing protein [Rhodospira trueperi]SDE93245.1 Protein of unknown function [Rhodospira trueperi]
MTRELVIYCDESAKKGVHFSNFYGGALVGGENIDFVRQTLNDKKTDLNLHGEVKWVKITENYRDKYIELMNAFFDLIDAGSVKVRIMFTQNLREPVGLTADQLENEYFLLYYQFVKHAFGLQHCNFDGQPVSIRVYFDRLPDTKEKVAQFKSYICGLEKNPYFRRAQIIVKSENIADVVSHEHVVLQCLDVILGSMNFRLNDLHKIKPEGQRIRGKRTRAKEEVFKEISRRIRSIYPNFNIGANTGTVEASDHWTHPYRHWLFIPSNHRVRTDMSKHKK